ncbi:MAG: hypothetical protein JRE28_12530 [Deltaproteobacteria bacterium]|nr:hypothetical protein [Deltaproteobacteria bacterium]
MQRIIYEKGQMWSWKRTVPYRIIGAIFFLMGGFSLLLSFRLFPPWWVYILPLSFLIPGIMISTFSEGLDIDARIRALDQWWKALGFKRRRREQFSNFQGVYLDTKVHHGKATYLVFEVWLMGTAGSLKAYTSSKEDEARTELERITVLTGLPETQPPSREMSSRMLMIIVVVALLLPILILGLFLIFRAVG